jgi:hypothetical protein
LVAEAVTERAPAECLLVVLTDHSKHELDDARLHSQKEERAVGARPQYPGCMELDSAGGAAAVPQKEQQVVADM